jgi:hypothetical protein
VCISHNEEPVFKVASPTSKGVIDYIHLDVWGAVVVSSNGGVYYFVSFIDDFSRSEVFTIFK